MQYRLYYSQFCYFCQKVLMALQGHQHRIELVSTNDANHRRELIEGGGKGQVPCLRIETTPGQIKWLYESDDILDYINKQKLIG